MAAAAADAAAGGGGAGGRGDEGDGGGIRGFSSQLAPLVRDAVPSTLLPLALYQQNQQPPLALDLQKQQLAKVRQESQVSGLLKA